MFADLSRDICKDLSISNCQWQIELTDDTGKSIFRLRLSAESSIELDQTKGGAASTNRRMESAPALMLDSGH